MPIPRILNTFLSLKPVERRLSVKIPHVFDACLVILYLNRLYLLTSSHVPRLGRLAHPGASVSPITHLMCPLLCHTLRRMAGGGDFVDMSTSSVITSDAMLDSILQNGEEDPGNQDGRERSEEKLQRVTLSYTPTYQRFRAKARTFTQQYSHMYTNRLRLMRPMLEAAATAKWGTGAPDGKEGEDAPTLCQKIIDLVDGARTSMVIGTIFKDMPLRPSLLDEYRDEAALQGWGGEGASEGKEEGLSTWIEFREFGAYLGAREAWLKASAT